MISWAAKKTTSDLKLDILDIPLSVNAEVIQDNICPNDSIGIISATVDNGRGPYDFNWSSGKQNILPVSTDTVSLLTGGIYNVTITDAEGCIGYSEQKVVADIPDIQLSNIDLKFTTCNSTPDGSIRLEVEGGTPPYRIDWNNGKTGNELFNIGNGAYIAHITDANNCALQSDSIVMKSVNGIELSADITNVSGNLDNGAIRLSVFGGTPPYSIDWNRLADNVTDHTALSAGTYCVTVTDDTGCFIDECFVVDQSISTSEPTETTHITLYPNPSTGIFYIDAGGSILSVDVFNTGGTLIQRIQGNYQLDLSDHPPGIYILKIESEKGIFIRKAIISPF